MTELEMLQAYWWLLIAVLGAAIVFMLFVQGRAINAFLWQEKRNRPSAHGQLSRQKMGADIYYTRRFWRCILCLISLFYSTSFGGAYWLWMSILISFVLQAVSYEYRRKHGNLYGTGTYDVFLLINGFFGCVLLGVAVGTMFFGGSFEIVRTNLLEPGNPVISRWAPTHGLEAIACWQCLLLGVVVYMLARTQASLYF